MATETNEYKVALIQSDLVWENPEENRINFTNKIIRLNQTIDLIVLPEMFTTGFTMNASNHFETMDGDTVSWMQEMSLQSHSAICGSLIIKEDGLFYNRLLFVFPNGHIEKYDKRHTFTLAGEDKVYTKGNDRKTISHKGWTIFPQICYDLRFPAWSRNVDEYDLVLYVANWPAKRISAWDTLLKARAIENMSYCIGVNRVGQDGNGHEYVGNSAAYNALGERLDNISNSADDVEIITLNREELMETREKLNFLADRDQIVVS
ncbi:MAG: amidohydrolase [Flavobacteriaceae bacterium]|nr:amidohydrolase [Flavobacteriaceae bacterium]